MEGVLARRHRAQKRKAVHKLPEGKIGARRARSVNLEIRLDSCYVILLCRFHLIFLDNSSTLADFSYFFQFHLERSSTGCLS